MTRRQAVTKVLQRVVAATEPALEPFSPDHKVYPQGWSWAMIERESERRYQSSRDRDRAQDWVWAVDTLKEKRVISQAGYEAAKDYYGHQQAAVGDVEALEVVGGRSALAFGWLWQQRRSEAIAAQARCYVQHHHDLTPMLLHTFLATFDMRQPSLEWVRLHGRVGGLRVNKHGRVVPMNQGETIRRIQWCVEVLADHFAEQSRGYGAA